VERYKSTIWHDGWIARERICVGRCEPAFEATISDWIAGALRELPIVHGFDMTNGLMVI
jgi:hypothetical protein